MWSDADNWLVGRRHAATVLDGDGQRRGVVRRQDFPGRTSRLRSNVGCRPVKTFISTAEPSAAPSPNVAALSSQSACSVRSDPNVLRGDNYETRRRVCWTSGVAPYCRRSKWLSENPENCERRPRHAEAVEAVARRTLLRSASLKVTHLQMPKGDAFANACTHGRLPFTKAYPAPSPRLVPGSIRGGGSAAKHKGCTPG